jgi:hypothetical protein
MRTQASFVEFCPKYASGAVDSGWKEGHEARKLRNALGRAGLARRRIVMPRRRCTGSEEQVTRFD